MPYAYIGPQSSGRVILQSVPRLVSEDCSWPCHSHSHRVSLSHSPVRYLKAALMKTLYLCFCYVSPHENSAGKRNVNHVYLRHAALLADGAACVVHRHPQGVLCIDMETVP
jgi:hypothetical protein